MIRHFPVLLQDIPLEGRMLSGAEIDLLCQAGQRPQDIAHLKLYRLEWNNPTIAELLGETDTLYLSPVR